MKLFLILFRCFISGIIKYGIPILIILIPVGLFIFIFFQAIIDIFVLAPGLMGFITIMFMILIHQSFIIPKKMETQESINNKIISEILDNIESKRSYYTGGSLFIDFKKFNDSLVLNLDGYCGWFVNSKINLKLDRNNLKKLFEIYRKYKNITTYYIENIIAADLYFDDMLIPKHYTYQNLPHYKGNGNMSIDDLENLCEKFTEYCHQQQLIKQKLFETIEQLKQKK